MVYSISDKVQEKNDCQYPDSNRGEMKIIVAKKHWKIAPSLLWNCKTQSDGHFFQLVKPYWIFGCLHGICQHLGIIYARGIKGKLAAFFYVVFYYGVFIFGLYREFKQTQLVSHTLMEIAVLLSSISVAVAALAALGSCVRHQKEFSQLRGQLIKVEDGAKGLGIWKSYRRMRVTSLAVLVLMLFEWVVLLCLSLRTGGFTGVFQQLIDSFSMKVSQIYLLTCCVYILFISHILAVANANIRAIYQSKLPRMCQMRHEKTLEKTVGLLSAILKFSKLLEQIYGFPLVLLMANLQIILFTHMYVFLETGFGVKALMISAQVTFATIFLAIVSQMAVSEFERTKLELLTLPVNRNVLFRRKISTLIRGVIGEQFTLSAYGVFTLNSTLIQKMASSVGFYLIMLLQFHLMLNQSTKHS